MLLDMNILTELKIMDETVVAMDRISELPTFIIHHLMSYLSAKEVARTSVLSKKWNQLYVSFPILDFDQNYFFPGASRLDYGSFCVRKQNYSFSETVKKFMDFVDASLVRFCKLKFCIQKFRLFLTFLDVKGSAPIVDRWIRLAVENGVRELDFENITDENTVYTLPQAIFSANSVTNLRLVWCRLEQPFDSIMLCSLKKLTLERVCLDEQMVQKLATECPLLEDLCFSNCWGLKHLCVSKASKLKIMEIRSFSEEIEIVEISVPSLQQLTLLFYGARRPRVVEVARSPHLKKLDLVSVYFADNEFNHLISKFPSLEDLFVTRCCLPGKIKISSNQLKNLLFRSCKYLKAIDVDAPNLLLFTYEFNPIPIISINVPCPWKVSFVCKGVLNTHWYLKLKKFLGVSKQIESLKLSLYSSKVLYNLDELSECSPSLPLQVENLELHTNVPLSDYETLLDCVFWICHPRTLRVNVMFEEDHKFITWLSDQLWIRDVNCCNSHPIKCWRHYLNDLKTENFLLVNDQIFLDVDNLMDGWTTRTRGVSEFHLDWCVPVLDGKS